MLTLTLAALPVYLAQESSARCTPGGVTRLNPILAALSLEGGMLLNLHGDSLRLGVGHISAHGIDHVDPAAESSDYFRAELTLRWP